MHSGSETKHINRETLKPKTYKTVSLLPEKEWWYRKLFKSKEYGKELILNRARRHVLKALILVASHGFFLTKNYVTSKASISGMMAERTKMVYST